VGRESKSEFTQTRFTSRQQQPETHTNFCQNRNDDEAGGRTVKAKAAKAASPGAVSRGRWTLYNDKLYGYLEDLTDNYSQDQAPLGRTKLEWHWKWQKARTQSQLNLGQESAEASESGNNQTPDCAFPLSIVEFLDLPQPPQHFGEMEMMYVCHERSDTLASAAGSIALSHR
jgi:hypothetical protein